MRHYYELEFAKPFNLEGGGQNGVVDAYWEVLSGTGHKK